LDFRLATIRTNAQIIEKNKTPQERDQNSDASITSTYAPDAGAAAVQLP
jgi:hypothetical protein